MSPTETEVGSIAAPALVICNASTTPFLNRLTLRLPFRREAMYAYRALSDERRMFTSQHDILTAVGDALGQRWAYYWHGAHHFPLDTSGDWTLAVSPESAGRVRFETCHLGRVRGTKWGLEGRADRVVAMALEARDEVLAKV